jgi:hypothetical protein
MTTVHAVVATLEANFKQMSAVAEGGVTDACRYMSEYSGSDQAEKWAFFDKQIRGTAATLIKQRKFIDVARQKAGVLFNDPNNCEGVVTALKAEEAALQASDHEVANHPLVRQLQQAKKDKEDAADVEVEEEEEGAALTCPVSMEPLASLADVYHSPAVCVHKFSKEIFSLFRTGNQPDLRPTARAKCPQPGCKKILTRKDLVLVS